MKTLGAVIMLMITTAINAQITSSALNGKITDEKKEAVIGAVITAVHEPSGTTYKAITDRNGRYSVAGMKAGGPYKVEISYIGYRTAVVKNIILKLADSQTLNTSLQESSELLGEVVVTADKSMRSNRSGAVTNVNIEQIAAVPTVNRSVTDLMRLTPQGSGTTNGFAVGGGNYRQSNVTIDGAQFNNTFGLGSNVLPGGGSPISIDALEQVTVSITPYDVRQSGFTGGAINAVTRSGTNEFKGSAYTYLTSNDLVGKKVGDYDKMTLEDAHTNTYGFTLGGPIVKDKLFFFVNGEYEDKVTAGPSAVANGGVNGKFDNINRRPMLSDLESLTKYMQDTYGFTTGPWQGYNAKSPSYRVLARLDWNINNDHKFNIRFTKSNRKASSGGSNSRNIGTNQQYNIYNGSNGAYGSSSPYGMSALSTRYYSEYRFTSLAAELNSRFGKWNNTLRATYSFQDQPRSNEYGNQPTVEIVMNDGQGHYPTWAFMGNDVFTAGNLSQTKNFVITDELSTTMGRHNLFAGLQYEYNKAVNGYAQAASGYYAYELPSDGNGNIIRDENGLINWNNVFFNPDKSPIPPRLFAITYGNNPAHDMFEAKMSTHQYAFYMQDNMDLTDNFKLSLGLRFELPHYPTLTDNFNYDYYKLAFGRDHFRTDNVPGNSISVSPRVGFNWDITGERKYILRGGTGIFVGRMPFVWLVSAVGNSGMGQTTYTSVAGNNTYPTFTMSTADMLRQIGAASQTSVPYGPTILGDDLRMPKTWKMSLAFDAKLPWNIDFTLEGIYNRDLNPCIVTNKNVYWDGESTIQLNPFDERNYMSKYNNNQAYVIENAGKKAYYWSVTAQLHKKFAFGLDLSAAYTHSRAKSYSEGIGDQVSSAYTNYRNSVNAVNDHETGYATYVAPNRILLSASYKLKEGRNAASTFSLIYDGSENGYMGNYSYARYSYIFNGNVTNDASAPGNLIRVPISREELNDWNFVDNGQYTDADGNKQTYTADMQRDDFWTYINQDDYLKERKGQYAERGGAKMPWHHQLDFKFKQDFMLMVGGRKHTLQLGCDITNVLNMLNSDWGTYKQVTGNNLLSYRAGSGANGGNGTFTYNMVNGARHLTTYQKYNSVASTYKVMFSIRYIFD